MNSGPLTPPLALFVLVATASVQVLVQVHRPATSAKLAPANVEERMRLLESLGKLPLAFEANQGQADSQVKFVSRGDGYTLYLTQTRLF